MANSESLIFGFFMAFMGLLILAIIFTIVCYILSSLWITSLAKKIGIKNTWFAWLSPLRDYLIKDTAGAGMTSFIILLILSFLWPEMIFTQFKDYGFSGWAIIVLRITGLIFLGVYTGIYIDYWIKISKKLNKSKLLGIFASPLIFSLGACLLVFIGLFAKQSQLANHSFSNPIIFLAFLALLLMIVLFPIAHLICLYFLNKKQKLRSPYTDNQIARTSSVPYPKNRVPVPTRRR